MSMGPDRVRHSVITRLKRHTRHMESKVIGTARSGVLLVAGSKEGLTLSRQVVGRLLPSCPRDGIGTYMRRICGF